jgi:GWxTD domain-containing protein
LTRDSRVGIPPFEIDFAAFADTAGQARLEVYYKLRNAGFTFAKKEERYAAGYELEIFVTGPDGREAGSKRASEEFSVENYEQTQSGESYRVNAAHFRLPPGSYRIKVQLTDQVSGEVFSTARKAEVPDFKTPALSDLELIGAFADSAGLPLFQKNGRTAIPSVTRAFGAADSLLPFFFELYASPARSPGWELVYEITQRYHGRWSAETLRVRPEEGVTPFFADLPLKNLPPGEYRLKLALKEGKKELARREADFKMNWNWEAALVYNFGDVLEILAYFSRAADLKELKKAAASKRRERWDEFWAGRDPTPATRENEAKDEFDRRVRFTDAYFGHMGLPGWKSDMGKIYIRFGEPDQVDEDPTGLRNTNPHLGESDGYASTASRLRSFGHPTQTWYYFADRRAFSFEDVTGNGSWVLKPPLDGRRF